MSMRPSRLAPVSIVAVLALIAVAAVASAQGKERRSWTVEDAKKIERVGTTSLSADGKWIAVQVQPPRTRGRRGPTRSAAGGEPQPRSRRRSVVTLYEVETGAAKRRFDRAASFRFSPDGAWFVYTEASGRGGRRGSSEAAENAPAKKAATEQGEKAEAKEKKAATEATEKKAANEGRSARRRSARWKRMMERLKKREGEEPRAEPSEPTTEPAPPAAEERSPRRGRRGRGGGSSTLKLWHIASDRVVEIPDVQQHTITRAGRLFYVTATRTEDARKATLWTRTFDRIDDAHEIDSGAYSFTGLRWQKKLRALWFQSNRPLASERRLLTASGEAGAVAPRAETEGAESGQAAASGGGNDAVLVPDEEEEKEKAKKKAAQEKAAQKKAARRRAARRSRRRGRAGRERPELETEAERKAAETSTAAAKADDDEDDAAKEPTEPTRVWSYEPVSKRLRPLVGPGVGDGFPEGEVLAGSGGGRQISSEMMARMRARFGNRMRGFAGRFGRGGGGGGVTLTKDAKRIFVRTQKPAPRRERTRSAASERSNEAGARSARSGRGARGERGARSTRTEPGEAGSMRERMMRRFGRGGRGRRSRTDSNKPEVVVWHWKDNVIPPEAEKSRGRRGRGGARRESTLWEVDLASGRHRKVVTTDRRESFSPNHDWLVDYDSEPYRRLTSWDRSYSDVYARSVATGKRTKLFTKFASRMQWTEDGRHMIWFEDGDWHRFDPATGERRNLTEGANLAFGEQRGGGGRRRGSSPIQMGDSLLLTDAHDVWRVPLSGDGAVNLTKVGRRDDVRLRPVAIGSGDTAVERYVTDGNVMLLSSFNNRTKASGFLRLDLDTGRLTKLIEMDKSIGTPRKAANADVYYFTVEGSDQCSDVWVCDGDFQNLRRVTDVNPWLRDLDLPKNMLVEWRSLDGEPLQGILTLPAGYKSGKRYPLVVYIYETLSQNMHRFKSPALVYNVPMWAAQGYAVLQPDIKYTIGRPGQSALKCVLPAVDKVVDMGIADNDRVGLIGHSWGGYETSYIITQTKRFACAVSGAPVVNMTSAYNGVRWQTGKPRQFQYERTQSRIGGSLWQYPERFIENSPIFHLENQTTPVLILFGDEDGAVPWWQGVEYMLALRRLGKPGVFLQYKNEGHGLRREANKKDYDKRVMEWFNHYLRDQKAPKWIAEPGH